MKVESEPLRLNIGSGDALTLKGYVNVDVKFGDVAYPLAYPDNSVDEIYASHILEHFPQGEVCSVLKDWTRALKPGGVLKAAVPDFHWIARKYLEGDTEKLPLFSYLMGGQTDERDYHKTVFDRSTLKGMLENAGLRDIQYWQSEVKDCASLPVSLNLMGRKPTMSSFTAKGEQVANGKHFVAGQWREEGNLPGQVKLETVEVPPIAITTSTPRYGSLLAADTMWQVVTALRAVPGRAGGAWWEQGLTRQIERFLDLETERGKVEFIITVDFDSYMTPEDGLKLIRLMYENPQLDCIVPMQVRRGMFEEVLAQSDGPVTMSDPLVPIVHGHFGFTVFRRRVFERLSKPWFLNVPDDQGSWGDGRKDADIYFWNRFCDEGFKAAMSTEVVIGHGDEGICWPKLVDGKWTKVWQSVFEWIQTHKPPEGIVL